MCLVIIFACAATAKSITSMQIRNLLRKTCRGDADSAPSHLAFRQPIASIAIWKSVNSAAFHAYNAMRHFAWVAFNCCKFRSALKLSIFFISLSFSVAFYIDSCLHNGQWLSINNNAFHSQFQWLSRQLRWYECLLWTMQDHLQLPIGIHHPRRRQVKSEKCNRS